MRYCIKYAIEYLLNMTCYLRATPPAAGPPIWSYGFTAWESHLANIQDMLFNGYASYGYLHGLWLSKQVEIAPVIKQMGCSGSKLCRTGPTLYHLGATLCCTGITNYMYPACIGSTWCCHGAMPWCTRSTYGVYAVYAAYGWGPRDPQDLRAYGQIKGTGRILGPVNQ